MKKTATLFQLGKLLTTIGINSEMKENPEFLTFLQNSLARHKTGDWGDLDENDKASNDDAIDHEGRIFSSYVFPEHIKISGDTKIWIVTEWDRSVTTIMFPSEY